MSLFTTLQRGLRHLFASRAFERDLDDELRDYLERSASEHVRNGASPEEAARAARREIGSVEAAKEEVRGGLWEASVQTFVRDVAYGARMLRRHAGFTTVVVLTLALGIGATTALVSVANKVLWERLPVRQPGELVLLTWIAESRGLMAGSVNGVSIDPASGRSTSTAFSALMFRRFHAETKALSDVFAFGEDVRAFTEDGRGWDAQGMMVSGNYFTGLGVPPYLGRVILPEDDRVDAEPVAVISHRYWQRRFGQDASALGKTIRLDDLYVRIVGVTPPAFEGTARLSASPDFAVPLALAPRLGRSGSKFSEALEQPWVYGLRIIGRLQPGSTMDDVRTELQGTFQQSALEGWRTNPRSASQKGAPDPPRLDVVAASQGHVPPVPFVVRAVAVVAVVVVLLLLIVCVNLTNLLLARAESRRREMSVRLALGARRGRLIRQLLTEALLMTTCGAVLGVLFAWWGKDLLPAVLAYETPSVVIEPRIDLRVLAVTAGVSVLVALVVGLVPALRATKTEPHQTLQKTSGAIASRDGVMGRGLLVVQVALVLALLVMAGLFVRTLQRLQTADVGFRTDNLLIFEVGHPRAGPIARPPAPVFDQFVQRLSSMPGVTSVGYANFPLLFGEFGTFGALFVTVPGKPKVDGEDRFSLYESVSPNYFDTLEMPMTLGRRFAPADLDRRVAIVNETFARQFLDGHPIGRRVGMTKDPRAPEVPEAMLVEIVGVVRDAKYRRVREQTQPYLFVSGLRPGPGSYVLRAGVPPMSLVPAIRAAADAIHADLRVSDFRTQGEQAALTFTRERHFAIVSSLFGGLALVLTSIGLYGLLSFRVARRTHEIGIHIALGAQRSHVVQSVARETLALVVSGVIVGLAAALAGSRLLRSTLYGVEANDPITLSAAVVLLLMVAALAAAIPAWRAARVDPLIALRCE